MKCKEYKPNNTHKHDNKFLLSYTLMCECWREDPYKRPKFSDLVSIISIRLEVIAGYMDLRCNGSLHVSEQVPAVVVFGEESLQT